MFTPAGGYYEYNGVRYQYGSTVEGSTLFYNANVSPNNTTMGLTGGNNEYGGFDENDTYRAAAVPVRCIKRK